MCEIKLTQPLRLEMQRVFAVNKTTPWKSFPFFGNNKKYTSNYTVFINFWYVGCLNFICKLKKHIFQQKKHMLQTHKIHVCNGRR